MEKRAIPKEVQAQVNEIVVEFNRSHFKKANQGYQTRFRGPALFLARRDSGDGMAFAICRLTYQGKMDDWEFAIYLHSRDRYDRSSSLG